MHPQIKTNLRQRRAINAKGQPKAPALDLKQAVNAAALRICRDFGMDADKEKHAAEDGITDKHARDEIVGVIMEEIAKAGPAKPAPSVADEMAAALKTLLEVNDGICGARNSAEAGARHKARVLLDSYKKGGRT